MSNIFSGLIGSLCVLGLPGLTQTKTGLALGSAYTYASAGIAYGFRWCAPTSGNLTDVWFFVTAHAGTPGVTTCELRGWNSTTATKPGTSALATQTVSPGVTDNKWINIHFTTPYSVTVGTIYWIVLGDHGWSTGNTITIDDTSGIRGNTWFGGIIGYTTTDGFTTAGTNVSQIPALVLKFADGTLYGCPYTTTTAYASSTLERGFKINGLTENVIVTAAVYANGSTAYSGLKIYSGTTAPGGTPELTVSFPTGSGAVGFCYFAPFTLKKNTVYRVVLTFGSANTGPQYSQIEDYATTTDVTNAGYGGGSMYGTIDNNDGTWADSIDVFSQMALIIQDQSVMPDIFIRGRRRCTGNVEPRIS